MENLNSEKESFRSFCNRLASLRRNGKRLIETATMADYIAWHDQVIQVQQVERPSIKETVVYGNR